jgi:hypothetical protein
MLSNSQNMPRRDKNRISCWFLLKLCKWSETKTPPN